MQGLGGSAAGLNLGTTMSGNKAATFATGEVFIAVGNQGTGVHVDTTFTALETGRYKFVLWGAGGSNGGSAGFGGSLAIRNAVSMVKGSQQAIRIGGGSTAAGESRSQIDFPDGVVMIAGGGNSNGTGNAASGGNINVDGALNVSASYAPYFGGAQGEIPAGGAAGGPPGMAGMVIVFRVS